MVAHVAAATARQRRAARRASIHWRTHTLLSLAESILGHAALVREANVLCTRLGLHVRLQLGVLRPWPWAELHSQHDGLELDDIRTHTCISPCATPKAIVRVMDLDTCTIQIWSCTFLVHQVRIWQRICAMQTHMLYDIDAHAQVMGQSRACFVPVARVWIPLIACELTVPILPLHGGSDVLGMCQIQVTWLAQHRACRIKISDVHGLSSNDLNVVHWQLRLGSHTYATQPVDLHWQDPQATCMQHTWKHACCKEWPDAVVATLFAQPTRTFLTKIEAQDQRIELEALRSQVSAHAAQDLAQVMCDDEDKTESDDIRPRHGSFAGSSCRKHERHRRWEQCYGVSMRIHLQEESTWLNLQQQCIVPLQHHSRHPCSVPSWLLRDAPAHLVCVTLTKPATGTVPWTHIKRVRMGNVSLVDARGKERGHDARFVPLQRVGVSTTTMTSDQCLCLQLLWRRATHDVPEPQAYLDTWHATLCVDVAHDWSMPTLTFTTHVQLKWQRVQGTVPAMWDLTLCAGEHVMYTHYCVRWTPTRAHRLEDLWRVDTRTIQVPGSRLLGSSWHVRGLSLVRDYLAELIWARRLLHALWRGKPEEVPRWEPDQHGRGENNNDSFAMLRAHWRGLSASRSEAFVGSAEIADTSVCTMRGPLAVQTDTRNDEWSQVWCELRGYVGNERFGYSC